MGDKTFFGLILAYLTLLVLGVYGWVNNIITLVQMDTLTLTGMTIARIIGISIAPLGAVLGYF